MNFRRGEPSLAVRELLEKAIEWGGSSWADLDNDLASGNAVLWVAETDRPVAALVTRRDGPVMEVWLCGGAVVPRCLPFLLIVEKEARAFGMTTGRITGRRGWARVLRQYGWREDGEDLVKDL